MPCSIPADKPSLAEYAGPPGSVLEGNRLNPTVTLHPDWLVIDFHFAEISWLPGSTELPT